MWNLKNKNKKTTKLRDTKNSNGCHSQEMESGQNEVKRYKLPTIK